MPTLWELKATDFISSSLATINKNIDTFKAKTQGAEQAFGRFAKNSQSQIGNWQRNNIDKISEFAGEIPILDRVMQLGSSRFALAGGAVTALATGLAAASAKAAQFDKAMAKANVTAKLNKTELAGLKSEIMNISRQAGLSDLNISSGAFERIISQGSLDAKQSLAALKPALLAAKAGFVDAEIAAAAMVNIMSSSGVRDTTKLWDTLFATLNLGNAQMTDIATYLPQIVPNAKLAGSSLAEVSGAFALLTRSLRSEQAAQGLKNIFDTFGDVDRLVNFKEAGIDVFDAVTRKMRPMPDIIDDINKKLNKMPTDLARTTFIDSLGLNDEAKMAISTMTANAAELRKVIDGTTNSTGQFADAIKNSANDTDQWNKFLANINYVATKLGQIVLPIVNNALSKFNWVLDGVITASQSLSNWIYGKGTPSIDNLTQSTNNANNTFSKLNPTLTNTKKEANNLSGSFQNLKDDISFAWDKAKSFASFLSGTLTPELNSLQTTTNQQSNSFNLFGQTLNVAREYATGLLGAIKQLATPLNLLFKTSISLMSGNFLAGFENAKDLFNSFKDIDLTKGFNDAIAKQANIKLQNTIDDDRNFNFMSPDFPVNSMGKAVADATKPMQAALNQNNKGQDNMLAFLKSQQAKKRNTTDKDSPKAIEITNNGIELIPINKLTKLPKSPATTNLGNQTNTINTVAMPKMPATQIVNTAPAILPNTTQTNTINTVAMPKLPTLPAISVENPAPPPNSIAIPATNPKPPLQNPAILTTETKRFNTKSNTIIQKVFDNIIINITNTATQQDALKIAKMVKASLIQELNDDFSVIR